MSTEWSKRPLSGVDPIGPFSAGLEVEGRRLVFVSGQGPSLDGELDLGSIEHETRLTLDNVGRVLASAGLDFENVVRCGVFLADLDNFAGMNSVYETFFPEPRPSRTTVCTPLLGGIKVEIDAFAIA